MTLRLSPRRRSRASRRRCGSSQVRPSACRETPRCRLSALGMFTRRRRAAPGSITVVDADAADWSRDGRSCTDRHRFCRIHAAHPDAAATQQRIQRRIRLRHLLHECGAVRGGLRTLSGLRLRPPTGSLGRAHSLRRARSLGRTRRGILGCPMVCGGDRRDQHVPRRRSRSPLAGRNSSPRRVEPLCDLSSCAQDRERRDAGAIPESRRAWCRVRSPHALR